MFGSIFFISLNPVKFVESLSTFKDDVNTQTIRDLVNKIDPSIVETELYSGTTGLPLTGYITLGICYELLLKHMSKDKINIRSQGAKNKATRQGEKGRTRIGGGAIKIGEMERDALIAWGLIQNINERFKVCTDQTNIYICTDCKKMCYKDENSKQFICSNCNLNNGLNINKVSTTVPYSFVVIYQRTMSMGIELKLNTRVEKKQKKVENIQINKVNNTKINNIIPNKMQYTSDLL